MSEKIYSLMNSVINALGGGWLFIITVGLELISFLTILLIWVLKRGCSLKNRAWFFLAIVAVLLTELAFLSLAHEEELFYLSSALGVLLSMATILLPERQIKATEQQRELARLIDKSINEQEEPPAETSPPLTPNGDYIDDISRFELDFQHVRLVLKKLEYYPLTATDKKIISELEESLYQAENQGFNTSVKSKINEGLGALLKIMSKYGV